MRTIEQILDIVCEFLNKNSIDYVLTEMDERTLRNKRKFDLNDIAIWIASPEDTIVNKLVFAREQDIKDALGILVRQYDSLDIVYLEKTAKNIGVYESLRELREKYESRK